MKPIEIVDVPTENGDFPTSYVAVYQRIYIYISTGWWFGTMEFYDFPYIGNVIIPTDDFSYFSEG